jgi:hypothetical protein
MSALPLEAEALVAQVDHANRLRDAGLTGPAEQVLLTVMRRTPESPLAYYEFAFIRRHQGLHREAAQILAHGLQAAGSDVRLTLSLAHMLHAAGLHERADSVLASFQPNRPSDAEKGRVIEGFGMVIREHPRLRTLSRLEALTRSRAWLDAESLERRIAEAQARRAPFAFVRLGDGEGAWLRMADAEEAALQPLYDTNRHNFSDTWFGSGFDGAASGFAARVGRLVADLAECDVFGIPYRQWIEHEYTIASTRGVPSLVNLCRALEDAALPPGVAFCSQNVHRDLHLSGGLARLLRRERYIGLLSCHPELPALLMQHFGLDSVAFHHLPGEPGRAEFITGAGTLGPHYPDHFLALQRTLSQPHEGRLFLVAGGILGKLHALTIRRHGGIALDIGSLADGWLGRATRPDFCAALMLRGPAEDARVRAAV